MKKNLVKIGGSALAFTLAGILSFQLVTNHEIVVDAKVDTLSGIEQIRNEIMGKDDQAYHILEIVPDRSEAEFGYLIGGSEPFYYAPDPDHANDIVEAKYLVGNSKLTYQDCSLWDENNHCWISVESKLSNPNWSEADKQTFMALITDKYFEKTGVNGDLKNIVSYTYDSYPFERGTLVFDTGDYNIDMVPLGQDYINGNYYIGSAGASGTIAKGTNLSQYPGSGLYYKKITDIGSDGNYYTGYILVGNIDAVKEDAMNAVSNAIVVVDLQNNAASVSNGVLTSGNTYTITPKITGTGYDDQLAIDSISYQVKVTYWYNNVVSETGFEPVANSPFGSYGLTFTTDENKLKVAYAETNGYKVTNVEIKPLSVSLEIGGTPVDYYNPNIEISTSLVGINPNLQYWTVDYNINNPSGTTLLDSFSSDTVVEGAYTIRRATVKEDTYYLAGWSIVSGGPIVYGAEQTIQLTENLTLFGVWNTKTPGTAVHTYYVNYHVNAPEGAVVTGTPTNASGIAGEYSLGWPSAAGYTFMGWATSSTAAESGTVSYSYGNRTVSLNSNLDLWGVWRSNEPGMYSITFDTRGGSAIPTTSGSTIPTSIPETRKNGYAFAGWYLDGNYTEAVVPGTTINNDITLFAKWDQLASNVFNIYFESNGGSICAGVTGTVLPDPLPTPTKDGFIFDGWFLDAGFAEAAAAGAVITKTVTLYAKWTAVPPANLVTYTVSFNENKPEGATGTVSGMPGSATVNDGESYEIPEGTPSLSGYTFMGWGYGDGPAPPSITVTSDVTLNATWVVDGDGEKNGGGNNNDDENNNDNENNNDDENDGDDSNANASKSNQTDSILLAGLDLLFGEPLTVSAAEGDIIAPYPYYKLSYSVINDNSKFDPNLQKIDAEFAAKYADQGFAFIESNEVDNSDPNGFKYYVYLSAGIANYVPDHSGNFKLIKDGETGYDAGNLSTVLAKENYGSFTNKEMFRQYVFDLEPAEYSMFNIQVHTYTPSELNAMDTKDINNLLGKMGLVYIGNGFASGVNPNGGTRINFPANDLTVEKTKDLFSTIVTMQIPTIVDASISFFTGGNGNIGNNGQNANIQKLIVLLLQGDYRQFLDANGQVSLPSNWFSYYEDAVAFNSNLTGVHDFILSYYRYHSSQSSIVNSNFATMGLCTNTMGDTGFEEVLSEIMTENDFRSADTGSGYAQLDTGINFGRAIRHIINYTSQRVVIQKTSLRVLEIQPNTPVSNSKDDELTKEIVSSWVGGDISADNITIDTMTIHEFVGHIEDLNSIYDLIYIGSDATSFNHETVNASYVQVTSKTQTEYVKLYNLAYNRWDYVRVGDPIYNYTEYTTVTARTAGREYVTRDTTGANPTVIVGTSSTPVKYYYTKYIDKPDITRVNNALVYNNGIVTIRPGALAGNSSQQAATYIPLTSQYRTEGQGGVIPVYNDQSMRGMIYTNIGDVTNVYGAGGGNILSGILRTDWRNGQIGTSQNDLVNSWVRYAGYDLSMEKYNALMDFVDASYPIVVSSRLYGTDNDGNRCVDQTTVDNSSYMYDFLNATLKMGNVVSTTDVSDGANSKFRFYVNRPKLVLTIKSYGPNDSLNASDNSGGIVHQLSKSDDGKFVLYYEFELENLGAVSTDTLYTLRLFLDTNADGKFSEAYEELEGIVITEKDSGATVSYNAIKTNKTYVAKRELPASYDGVLTWDLQVEQNKNAMIRCSEEGYTKILNGRTAEIKILQIMKSTDNNANLNLQWAIGTANDNGSNTDPVYQVYHSLVYGTKGRTLTVRTAAGNESLYVAGNGINDDYHLKIESITTDEYARRYANKTLNLDQYDMLILGFSDMYQDIKADSLYGDGGLIDFIESGKSVLFAHDTTSFWQYDTYWSYYMNRYIRNYVGMDTYGVTMAYTKQVDDWQYYDVLRSGYGFSKPATTTEKCLWNLLYPTKDANGRYNYNTKNIAFKPGSNRTRTVPEVQGFAIQPIVRCRVTSDQWAWINDTSYRNYYNFHPNYNTAYNGMDRTNYVQQINKGQITSYPYKLDSFFYVPQTHGQYYSLDMNADDDEDGETDVVVWYTLTNSGSGYYNVGGNDCLNNYYIYNKGNVTYTGVGHSGKSVSVMEAKLFINTMVAAYNAGTRDIKLSITDKNGNPATTLYEYVDLENQLYFTEDVQRIYFTYNDPNIVKTNKNGAVSFYMTKTGNSNVPASITENGVTYHLKESTVTIPDSARTKLYSPANGITIDARYKQDYYVLAQTKEGDYQYVSMAELFEKTSLYRCDQFGFYPNRLDDSSGQNYWYVRCFNWNTSAFEIIPLVDQASAGNAWWKASIVPHLYTETITTSGKTQVIEFTDMVVRRKSDDSIVSYGDIGATSSKFPYDEMKNKEFAILSPDQIYYIEIPLNALREAGIISYDITKNDMIIGVLPYYSTVNKFTNAKKFKYGNLTYQSVNYASVNIFDLD